MNRWNSHWNSRIENGPFLRIPGNSHTEGVPCIQRGFFCIQRGGVGGVSYQYSTNFLIHRALVAHVVVVGATAIRANLAVEQRRNKETAHDFPMKLPIYTIKALT